MFSGAVAGEGAGGDGDGGVGDGGCLHLEVTSLHLYEQLKCFLKFQTLKAEELELNNEGVIYYH